MLLDNNTKFYLTTLYYVFEMNFYLKSKNETGFKINKMFLLFEALHIEANIIGNIDPSKLQLDKPKRFKNRE